MALESTSVYWQPLWNLLEDRFTLLLVNAQHVHQVPGRETDVRDCEWLADLLRHEAGPQQAVPQQVRRPLAIPHIGLAPGHLVHVLGIDQQQRETVLQQIPERLPVDARALERHVGDALLG